MHRYTPLAVLFVALLVASRAGAGPSGPDARQQLRGPFVPPEWLAGVEVPFTVDQLTATNKYGLTIWREVFPFQSDPARFREAVATLHRTEELNTEPSFKVACYQNLAYYYEGMFQDYVRAFQMFREVSDLADDVEQVHDWQNHLSRDTRRFAGLGMARC